MTQTMNVATSLELLIAVASGPGSVLERARQLIGEDRLAILIAKGALADTSMELSATRVAEVLGINRTTAINKIDLAAVKNGGVR